VDRATLAQTREEDLAFAGSQQPLDFVGIYFANIFFRRFYLKNSYCRTNPFLIIVSCCYVASKAEESPVHIKDCSAGS
ncbi:hypothetical protein K435DRAFT_701477, partial [Dendrothele bispora CBS 962.96]